MYTSSNERLTAFLNTLKKRKKIRNDAHFASVVGVPTGYLSEVLSGKRNLTDRFAHKIKMAFSNINIIWLLTGEGEMLKETETKKIIGDEVSAVPEDAYMMAEYVDLRSEAGYLGGGDTSNLSESHKRLVPREYEKGVYLVVRVSGDSMNDGTARALCDGDEVLIRELSIDERENLPYRQRLFVITTREGNVLKQITEVNKDKGYILCHSFNKIYDDFKISLEDIFQIFVVYKVVQKQIILN